MLIYLVLCVIAATGPTATALKVKCGDSVSNSTGSFGVPSGLVAKKACNVTLTGPDDHKHTTIQFSLVNIAPKDTLVIYDGEKYVLANFTARSVARQVLVSFQKQAVIVFTPSANTTLSTWSLDFDMEKCEVSIQYSGITSLSSPSYLKTPQGDSLLCTYTLTSFLPSDQIAAAAFSTFFLMGDSSLEVSGAQGDPTYTSETSLQDFFADGLGVLTLTLNITDTSERQNFSLVIEPVLQECSGEVAVNGSLVVLETFPSVVSSPGKPASCRWLLSSERPLLQARVSGLLLAADGSGDTLAFRPGGSSKANALDTLMTNVDDYLVVTSSDKLLVTFTMGPPQAHRELNVTFTDADFGGIFQGQGYLSAGQTTTDEEVFFSLVASPGKWVDVTSMTNLTEGSSVSFYDGAQPSSSLLAVWSAKDQALSPVTGHEQMLVVLSGLASGETFNASFTSVPAGCDSLTSAPSGQRTFSSAGASKAQTCSWTVAPVSASGTVVLSFSSISLKEKESLTVTAGLKSSGQVLAKFTGPYVGGSPLPQVYVSASQKFRVSFTYLAASSSGSGASVQYRTLLQVCGGELAEPLGQIRTPNYPNQYPLNAMCDWTVKSSKDLAASASSLLLLSFSSLSLAQNHSISVTRSIKNKTKPAEVARYGGISSLPSNLPNDLILPGAPDLAVAFCSEPSTPAPASGSINQVAGGASLNYWILECGGNLTKTGGSFTSPEFSKAPTKSALCVWILNVGQVKKPVNSTNILSYNITVAGKNAKSVAKYLRIYDGSSLRAPFLPLRASASNLSRYDSIVVVFNLTIDGSSKPDVRVNFTYKTINCNSSQLCANGICMHPDWICNGHDDCGDNSDEQNCVIPPPKPPKPAQPQSYSGWVKSGWVPACLFIGLVLGAGLVLIAPRIIRRLRRGGSGNYNRMESPAVA